MTGQRPKRLRRAASWSKLDDEALLDLRLDELVLPRTTGFVPDHMQKLYRELRSRGIRLRPHFWYAEEWFSPDGVPGIAVPFYLAHPRLQRLERHLMQQVEGGNSLWLTRILRHEAGHAIDTAWGLSQRPDWRRVFGSPRERYPSDYRPRPASRRHVLHLGHWYAQSHPTEDFAETFAVWLQPRARWRREYADWPALRKLEFVDGLMAEIARQPRPGVHTCLGGGYVASGSAGPEKLPQPYLPEGCRLLVNEGAGEVQTPLLGDAADGLKLGDNVYMRHSKAGELCERFNSLLLVEGDEIVDEVPTYRGEGQAFL